MLTGLPDIQKRRDLLDQLGICPACLARSIHSQDHNGQPCEMLNATSIRFLKCTEPGCRVRGVLCTEHKTQNSSLLSLETERISRISSLANVCFIAVNQRIERIGKQNFVGFTKAYGTTTKNHIYGDVVDLCNSVPTVREIQGGEPHFLLFLMKGLDNSSVVTIFDTAASYSLFKEDILGTKIKATPVSNQNGDLEERVGGIGGSVTARNYLALLPVLGGFGEHEHQLTVCQSVQNIVSLKTVDTSGLAQEILDHHPEAGLPQDFRLPNFAPLGDTLEVEALIGLADFAIFPKIVFETSLGVNIYKVPIQAAQGQPQFCFGGNICRVKRN